MTRKGRIGSKPIGATMIEKQYNYFYKITNLINDKFYYGIHSTNNLDDKYMGSGSAIRKAISKYGADNFKKEIIKYFDTFQEACDYEKEIVNKELLKNPDCYNLVEGGYYLSDEIIAKKKEAFNRINHQSKENNSNYNKKWIKKNNECIAVDKGDLDEYLNDGWKLGRIVDSSKTKALNKIPSAWICNESGETKHINIELLEEYLKDGWRRGRVFNKKDDKKLSRSEYIESIKGFVVVRDSDDNIYKVKKDDARYLSGELISINKGKYLMKDKEGNSLGYLYKTDPRYLSGDAIIVKNDNLTTKNKVVVKDVNGVVYCVDKDDPRYLSGELVGVNKGKSWKWSKNKYNDNK